MTSSRASKVRNSALWAAAGDAIGWITELTDVDGLRRRSGSSSVDSTVGWVRKIGGLRGVSVDLPAGAYSDDTQLRLAVCRSISASGMFDVEAFAKIELTVWPSYALGAGRGTKAAAANLAKRDVNWFSNFFDSKRGPSYVLAGGNGAAMRIQPHVWAAGARSRRKYLSDVVRDSVTTHGHMLGICGAVFHADCVAYALDNGQVPGPAEWARFVDELSDVASVVNQDDQLSRFWLGAWEALSGQSIRDGVSRIQKETSGYLQQLDSRSLSYERALDLLECRGARLGAGMNTALAAAYVCWTLRNDPPEEILKVVANAIGSDTDTIGTMAGAIIGAVVEQEPTWSIQDREYIESEADRMSDVANGVAIDSFGYPDLSAWQPPVSQADSLGVVNEKLALKGLGYGRLVSERWIAGDYSWQWIRLDFGQTLLCKGWSKKAKKVLVRHLPTDRVPKHVFHDVVEVNISGQPKPRREQPMLRSKSGQLEPGLFGLAGESSEGRWPALASIDELTNVVIKSQFDEAVLGRCMKECARGPEGVERAIAFAAIIAKAMIARARR